MSVQEIMKEESRELIKETIRQIEEFDNMPDPEGTLRSILGELNKKLQHLTDNTLTTRIWSIDDTLHCVVLYPNNEVRELFQ